MLSLVFFSFANGVIHHQETTTLGEISYVKVGGCALNPGAGMDASAQPFQQIYKDGFYHTACINDKMEDKADKHGANRMSYGVTGGVSIVRYNDRVGREDQEKMSPRVCFDFCRTVEDMGFFGLAHGRDCYCTPYFLRQPGAGMCDLMCEGDDSVTCGGSVMSDIYEMHACDDTADQLGTAISTASGIKTMANTNGVDAMQAAADMEASADALQAAANTGGDMTSNNYGQQAKVFAGETKHIGEASKAAAAALQEEITAANLMTARDFTIPDNAYEAEESATKMTKLGEVAKSAGNAAKPYVDAASPDVDNKEAYVAVQTFETVTQSMERWAFIQTSKNATGAQSTCEGALAADPIVGQNMQDCAFLCDANAPQSSEKYCVGFQHYQIQGEESLCFLLTDISKVWRYDCDYVAPSFLQKKGSTTIENKCMVKSSWAQAAPVKPEVTELPRCFGEDSTPPTAAPTAAR